MKFFFGCLKLLAPTKVKPLTKERIHHKKWEDLEFQFFSVGGEETFFYLPQKKIAFDVGRGYPFLSGAKSIFLSHCHADHVGGLVFLGRTLALQKKRKTKVFLPKESQKEMERILKIWEKVEGKNFPLTFIPWEAGEKLELGKRAKIQAFSTYHSIPSLGYFIYHKVEKLKEEYQRLSFAQIAKLKEEGVSLTYEKEIPFLAYTGDTSVKVLDSHPELYQAKYLILECTFIDEKHRDLAFKQGHIHLDDIVERANYFQNEQILLFHFSPRYSPKEIQFQISSKLPATLWERVFPCL
ncbi:MAG: hypothetical protein D6785_04390 [Planctomycetota bacterium]|nr:MAG: hypothetical protein D6785_04390 [Planctomycetota bacterium]